MDVQTTDNSAAGLEEYEYIAPRCRCTISAVVDGKKRRANLEKMAATDKPQWAVRNRAKILTKDEYNALKELATAHGISFIGVKQFDGSAETVTEFIDTLGSLLIQFPKATDKRHK